MYDIAKDDMHDHNDDVVMFDDEEKR